ncbi:MAG: Maf family protein [Saprospiraceae bacterium]
MDWMTSKKLILASQSPRRKELLTQAGFEFTIRAANIDEDSFPTDLPIHELPVYLAREKAEKVFKDISDPEALVLAADSLVFLNGKIFTKPIDRADAIKIIEQLAGNTHQVITGICLMDTIGIELESIRTEVTFEKMHLEEIEYYIDTYLPYDKAGAYGIQDWIGLCKVAGINGSYSNIMGLPMETVYKLLEKKLKK